MAIRGAEVFTIGYEGRQPDELIAMLRAHRVDRLIDVRERPSSRRKGFSKSALRDALAAAGIDYVHVRAAGNPLRHRHDDRGDLLAAYTAHLDGVPEAVAELAAAIDGHRAALLCVERDPASCHRSILAGRLRGRGVKIVDL